jgi:diguanylate cyclase (GGDEF)-like protein
MRRTLELDELTRRDPLTGLANRRAYDTWLAGIWSREAEREGRVGLIVVDIDRFREYNEFCGHDAGDDCLKKVAVCLRDQLRGTSDQIARLGGAGFAVLLPGLSEEICADVAERLRLAVQNMELPHLGLGVNGIVTVSAGVASHVVLPGSAPSALFQAADTALYQSKIFGRNRVCIATLAMPVVLGAPVSG